MNGDRHTGAELLMMIVGCVATLVFLAWFWFYSAHHLSFVVFAVVYIGVNVGYAAIKPLWKAALKAYRIRQARKRGLDAGLDDLANAIIGHVIRSSRSAAKRDDDNA
jgi:hypothetical protein